jgi:hypothetical protein
VQVDRGEPGYDKRFDMNGDSYVEILDVLTFVELGILSSQCGDS